METTHTVAIIDGQGGSLGKSLVEAIKTRFPQVKVLAIGTNSLAASAMLRSGADAIATGENPVVVAARTADLIVGPLGIITADALHGEITPTMAVAVAQSRAHKILLPISKCNVSIVGRQDLSLGEMINLSLEEIQTFLDSCPPQR
ncbi:MAG: DUF3842 family protein [Spirochaetia bacterium]|uniref:DUF3842 family protein n=1 Tax=Sphaerochaeta sp. TaxID=1972642 RepID=UPI001D7A9FE4|nr:DUF3842 family protein [Spirochaetia bacterium]NCC90307.1 DUF3842 family protein [Spirochaetia bacterium]